MKILLVIFLFLFGCAERPLPLIKVARASLGTIVEITVADGDKSHARINSAIKKAFREIERIEDLLSSFKDKSDVSRINAEANIRPTKVSSETINLLEKAINFSQLSDGAFDITVHPLTEIWGFSGKYKKSFPEPEELSVALNKVGYQHINIVKQEQSVFLARAGMSLDLGGIAKGYAVDKAIAVLKQEGINNALVNAGGDIYCLGRRSLTEKWAIGVRHPRKKNTILTVLELEGEAIATSGDYQRYIEIGNQRYGHIIDPRTGIPSENASCGITILAKDCLTADALATSVFVLGPKQGLEMINVIEDAEAIVASIQEGKLNIQLSSGLEDVLEFNGE